MTVHILPQQRPHTPVYIIGTREALEAVREAITAALDTGYGAARVFADDGEGYPVYVTCVTAAQMAEVPLGYVDDSAQDDRALPGWVVEGFRGGKVGG